MPNQLEEWFLDVPVVTRVYLSALFGVALACQLDLLSPYTLYFHWGLIRREGQWHRLAASFFFLDKLSFDFVFHTFFLVRYCRMLEEGSFRGSSLDFLWFLVLGACAIVGSAVVISPYAQLPLLSSPLSFMLVYLWSRRNTFTRMNFLGVFTFHAPLLPYVLLAFSIFVNGRWPTGDIVGLAVGHVYYFVQDVLPTIKGSSGRRYFDLATAGELLRFLTGRRNIEVNHAVDQADQDVDQDVDQDIDVDVDQVQVN